jgi:choline-sulfatase
VPWKSTVASIGAAACLAGALACRGPERDSSAARAVTTRPANVLLITIDTLRADRVGVGLTPALDDLASRGVRFIHARTVAPLTLPAHVSLMTGVIPPVHGVRENGTYRFDGSRPTLARLLQKAGFETAAFVGACVLDRRFGLNDGFDVYDDQIERDPQAATRLEAERRGEVVAGRAIEWLRSRRQSAAGTGRPFFAWVHFWDPHAPYTPPAGFLQKAGGNAYNGEVAYTDAQVARLIGALEAVGERQHTLIVVAGDHGESLGEHGERTHGMLLYEAVLRVPLIVSAPGATPAVRPEPVSLLDIAPTVLASLGMPLADGMHGANLLAGALAPDREFYSETEYPRVAGWSRLYSLARDRWKVIRSSVPELYDLDSDPGEARNEAAGHQATAEAMTARLTEIRRTAHGGSRPDEPISPEVAARLRALGYVASSSGPAPGGRAPNPADVIQAWVTFEDGLAALSARQFSRAGGLLKGLARAHPDAAVFQSTYARALQESGDLAGALAVDRQAVARHPADATLLHELAVSAREAGRHDEALRAEQAALTIDPRDPAALNGLGLLHADRRRFAEAAAAFEQSVAFDPTSASYWTNLGNARRDLGAPGPAEQAYRHALELDPRHADAANGLGVLLVQSGKPAEAIPWFERALAGAPDFYEARMNLGIANQGAGRSDAAAAAYRAVLAAPPRFARERQAAAKLLESLPGRRR